MQKLWSYVAIPATALAVLTGSVAWVVLLRPFYYVQIGPLGVCQASGLTAAQARAAYNDVMDYCLGLRPDFAAGMLPFSAEGASHFADVRVLFILNLAFLALSVAVLSSLRGACLRQKTKLPRLAGRTPGFWAACALGGVILIVTARGILPQLRHRHRRFPAAFMPGAYSHGPQAKKIKRVAALLQKKYPRLPRGFCGAPTYRSLGCQSQSAKIMSSRSPKIQLFIILYHAPFFSCFP